MPAALSSGVGSDRTRPNRLDLWNLNGSDPIGSDRSFEFRCRTAARPERKGTANLLPRGQGKRSDKAQTRRESGSKQEKQFCWQAAKEGGTSVFYLIARGNLLN
ncbi:hypothetical protein Q3G72_014973 [Acer saccharum]|nr:hypothetical protein Q3G72_014973 [Acer saccharum]